MTDTGKCPAFGYDCEYVAKVEAQAAEIERLESLIGVTANHWLALQDKHPILWEGAIDAAMAAACAEIERLREALALFGGESAIEAKQLFIRMTAAAKCSGKRKELAARHFEAARKAAIARAALGERE